MANKIQVHFYPDVDKSNLDYGVMKETSWQRLADTLEKFFLIHDNERIEGITVTEYGIKAKIGTINS